VFVAATELLGLLGRTSFPGSGVVIIDTELYHDSTKEGRIWVDVTLFLDRAGLQGHCAATEK